ncbi:unnamed protein product [Durusdinium trenchii]|uniref:Uncharacterized protein n=1 Tax=Durusdinium trenchii TaxID=1381693 RepID=A0ABP0RZY9_9DINO
MDCRAAIRHVIQEMVEVFSKADETYQEIQEKKEDMNILTGLHNCPDSDPCCRADLTAEKPAVSTKDISALRTTIEECEARARQRVEDVMSDLRRESLNGKSSDRFAIQKELQERRKEQLAVILEEKNVLQFIQDGAERSKVLTQFAGLSAEKLELMTEDEKDVYYSKARSERIQQRYQVGIKVAEELLDSKASWHRNIEEKRDSLNDLAQSATEGQEAWYQANSIVKEVRKQMQKEMEKRRICEAKGGQAFMKHKAAMESLWKLMEEIKSALSLALDTAIECEALEQHEQRLTESVAEAMKELEDVTKACDEANKSYEGLEEQVSQGKGEIMMRIQETQKELLSHSTPYVKEHMKNVAVSMELLDRVTKEKKKELRCLQKEHDAAATEAAALASMDRGNKRSLKLATRNEEVATRRDLIDRTREELEQLDQKNRKAREEYDFCRHLQLHNPQPQLEHEEATRFAQAEADRCLGNFKLWVQDPEEFEAVPVKTQLSPKAKSPREKKQQTVSRKAVYMGDPRDQRLESHFLPFGQQSTPSQVSEDLSDPDFSSLEV